MYSFRCCAAALVAVVLSVLIPSTSAEAAAPFDYPVILGSGNLGSDNFRSGVPGVGVVNGLVGTDQRTSNQVSASLFLPSTADGRVMSIAGVSKIGATREAFEVKEFPVRGVARWRGTFVTETNVVTGEPIAASVEAVGRASIRGGGGGSAINLNVQVLFTANSITGSALSVGDAQGVLRYDRTANVRYQGSVSGWTPAAALLRWDSADMNSLTRPGTPPRAFQGMGELIVAAGPLANDVRTNVRLQVLPEARARDGVMGVNMVSLSSRVRLSARHDYSGTREQLSVPGVDWADILARQGVFVAVSRVGTTEGIVRRIRPGVLIPVLGTE